MVSNSREYRGKTVPYSKPSVKKFWRKISTVRILLACPCQNKLSKYILFSRASEGNICWSYHSAFYWFSMPLPPSLLLRSHTNVYLLVNYLFKIWFDISFADNVHCKNWKHFWLTVHCMVWILVCILGIEWLFLRWYLFPYLSTWILSICKTGWTSPKIYVL